MPSLPPAPAHRRADHVRNRAALLDAARAVFAEQGADASVGEIVRRAGFAKGTFFRHFPTKEVLVQALLIDRLIRLREIAHEINSGHTPGWSTLSLVMERLFEELASDRSLGEFFDRGEIKVTAEIQQARRELAREVDGAVHAAQAVGEVRPDVAGTDFPPIIFMITRTTARRYTTHPHLGRRYLRLFLDGIRAGHTTDLGGPPLTAADMEKTRDHPGTSAVGGATTNS